ncbi:sugar kinase [Thalassospira australica]|uniref:sugar kinase n=1 Tax=Thalassospira australica TaxID=1528106 RepID=UPI00384EDA4C
MTRTAFIGECMIELAGTSPGSIFGAANLGFAGDTLNGATYMVRTSRLLATSDTDVSYITALGTDPYSDAMIAAWQKDNIDTSLVRRIDGALPGLYAIQTDETGERSFSYWRNDAAAKQMLQGGHDAVLRDALRGFDCLYLSGITLAILSDTDRKTLIDIAENFAQQGGKVCFDTNHRPRLWADQDIAIAAYLAIAPHCHTVLPTFDDDSALFGDATPDATAKRWHSLGATEVVVKCGGEPTFYSIKGGKTGTITPPRITDIVDTTSAGDSFNGSYLAARNAGLDVPAAIAVAQKVAGRVISRRGALVDISDLKLDQ